MIEQRRPDVRPERLEPRVLLSSALLKTYVVDTLPRDLVYDGARSVLYAVRDQGVDRYDVRAGEWQPAWRFGSSLRDADISPDGAFLYVTDGTAVGGRAVVHRVDLASGAVGQLTYDAPGETGTSVVNVTAENKLLVVGSSNVLRSLDPATGQVAPIGGPGGPGDTVRGPFIRSADRRTILTGFMSAGPFALYDVSSGAVLGSRLFASGQHMAVSRDGSHVAFESSSAGNASGFNPDIDGSPIAGRDLQFIHRLPQGEVPAAFDPTRPVLYSFNVDAERVAAFDTTTWARLYDVAADTDLEPGRDLDDERVAISDDGTLLFRAIKPTTGRNNQRIPGGLRVFSLDVGPEIEGLSRSVPDGRPATFTVTIRDRAGNVVPDFAGTVTFHSDDPDDALPAPLTFTPADGGTRTASVTFAARGGAIGPPPNPTLRAVITATGAADSVDGFAVDAARPTAAVSASTPFRTDSTTRFEVGYADDVDFNDASLGGDDVIVRTPAGEELPARFVEQLPTSDFTGKSARAVYEVTAPGGTWDYTDNGAYQIVVRDGGVTDGAGNGVAQAPPGAFTVDIAPPPPPLPDAVVSLAVVGLGGGRVTTGSTLTLRVTVRNLGDAVLGVANVGIELNDGTIFPESLYNDTRRLNLQPGKAKAFNVKVRIPDDAHGTGYWLTAYVDPDGIDDKTFEDNQAESEPFEVRQTAGPFRAAVLPTPLVAGQKQSVTFLLQNDGSTPVRGRYEIELIARPFGLYTGTQDHRLTRVTKAINLRPGRIKPMTFRFTVPHAVPTAQYLLTLVARSIIRPTPYLPGGGVGVVIDVGGVGGVNFSTGGSIVVGGSGDISSGSGGVITTGAGVSAV